MQAVINTGEFKVVMKPFKSALGLSWLWDRQCFAQLSEHMDCLLPLWSRHGRIECLSYLYDHICTGMYSCGDHNGMLRT